MSLQRSAPLRRAKGLAAGTGLSRSPFKPKPGDPLKRKFMCRGKRYADMESALASKPVRERGATATKCTACGGVHVTGGVRPRKDAPPADRRPPKETGPDRKTRSLVLLRDQCRCVRCGRPAGPQIGPYSIQHRVARGVGGGNEIQNLILLCGSATTLCHGEVEARHPEDQAKGYRLESWQDPAMEPVMVFSPGGSGITVWLTEAGGHSTVPPEEVGAA